MIRLFTYVYMLFLYAPIAIITLFSFHSSASLSFPFEGFSTQWYEALFSSSDFMTALTNSAIVAAGSTILTTLLGTFSALALMRMKGRVKSVFAFMNFAPIALPGLFLGIALVIFFSLIGLPRSLLTVVIGHTLFTFPFFVESVRSRLEYFDLSFEEAARDLGATPLKAFWLVTLPIIGPTIAGAAILAVALSMDEFLITVFVTGSDTTLPLMILSMMRRAVSPTINAASVFMLVVTIAIIVIAGLVMTLRRRRLELERAETAE
ncbi:ABC transporter permease [Pseudomonas arsenicoxydans]|uniref:Polyamine ABC transporter permease n=2 Tax=Pseudomonas TaxID=286 RepID=A0A4V0YK01_9PSED|nr:ABC transporter permease [Pseudomonas arsenicoxydans]QAY85424.1 polyamine ABC transporter permease [Pseudomonas arsenicoxydans]